jgi:hypothetical protein
MKKIKLQNQFFEELKKIPIIQVACEKTNLSRNTVYRWKKEDQEFSKKMDQAISDGVDFVNDMSESQLLTLIKEKSWPAISFWLKHRNSKFKERIEIEGGIKVIEELSPEKSEQVKNALTLANLILNKKHD